VIGLGPNIVVVNRGMGRSLTSTMMRDDVYAFIHHQGLLAGLGIQGSRSPKLSDACESTFGLAIYLVSFPAMIVACFFSLGR
jgi:lipid-binding SYLF domain-containing protein